MHRTENTAKADPKPLKKKKKKVFEYCLKMHKWQVLLCSNVTTAFISLILAQIPTKAVYFMSGLGGSHQNRPSGSHCIASF